MATPCLRALRKRYTQENAQIVGIMRPYLAEVLRGAHWLDESWFFDPRSSEAEGSQTALVRRLRARGFDMAVLLPNSLRSALLAWCGRAKERIGFVRDGRGMFLTGKVYPQRRNGRRVALPMVDYYLRIAEAAGCLPEPQRLELSTVVADEQSADGVWARLGLRDDRVVLLNCSGAYGASKLWPSEYFGQLARRIAGELEYDILVMCGPKEIGIACEIVSGADHPRVFSMADQPLDLGTAKACIRRGRLMVSTDSGPRHVAAAFGKPVITLFGPMLPIWTENPTQEAVNLILPLDCAGCRKRVCPLGHHRCMRDMKPDMVYGEVVQMLNKDRSACAA
jgi:heptosyltransferase-2